MSVVVRRNYSSKCHSVLNGTFVRTWLLALFCIVGLMDQAQAGRVTDLYREEISVTSQSAPERERAMSQALTNVIIRVTGQREAMGVPGVQAAVNKPAAMVQSYSYRNVTEDNTRKLYLQVSFDLTLVNRLLRESSVAIWGVSRPTTLAWIALEENGHRRILNASAELPQVMEDHFKIRGLPTILPLMDFEDSINISAVDIWGGFSDRIVAASERYGSEAILVGRLRKEGERYSGRLSVLFRGRNYVAEVDNLVGAGVASMAADLVGKVLSSHYAVISGEDSEKPMLVVENIQQVEDYAAVIKYLNSLTAVRDVAVHKVKGSVIELELSIDGSVAQLADALALGRSLIKNGDPDYDADYRQRLFYRWSQR